MGLIGLSYYLIPLIEEDSRIKEGKGVLVTTHGNSIQGIFKCLVGFFQEVIMELNLPSDIVAVYKSNKSLEF